MTGEKEAPDHIVNANKMVDAPAEMPGVEEIARAIASWRHHLTPANPYRPSILPSERAQADAVMALFAPILAEKEREIGQAKSAALLQGANIDVMNAAVDTARDFVRQAKAAEARALAAEAALAAAHEGYQQAAIDTVALLHDAEAKLAGLRQAILDADIICDDDEKAGDRLARLADHIRAQTRDSLGAAAIRAERERCAKIAEAHDGLPCRSLLEGQRGEDYDSGQIDASTSIAAAIRAEGE